MTANEILGELDRRGVRLEVAGDKLRVRPKEAVGTELIEALRERKPEILAILKSEGPVAGYGLCPGSEKCTGGYSVGLIDGRERLLHPPKGRSVDWAAWKLVTDRLQ